MNSFRLKEKVTANGNVVFDTTTIKGEVYYTVLVYESNAPVVLTTCTGFPADRLWVLQNAKYIKNVQISGASILPKKNRVMSAVCDSKFGRIKHIMGIRSEYIEAAKELDCIIDVKRVARLNPAGFVDDMGCCELKLIDPWDTETVTIRIGLLDFMATFDRYMHAISESPQKVYQELNNYFKAFMGNEYVDIHYVMQRLMRLAAKLQPMQNKVPVFIEEWAEPNIESYNVIKAV